MGLGHEPTSEEGKDDDQPGHEPTSEEGKDDDQPGDEPTSEEVKDDNQPRPKAGDSKATEVVSVTSISFSYVCIPTLYIRPSDSRDY